MRFIIRSLFLIIVINIFCSNLFAQLPLDTLLWQIETIDGNSFIGKVTQQDEKKIILKTETFGTITIPRIAIRKMVQIEAEELVGGVLNLRNPHASRYFFGPNGYGLKKTEAYYENTWILFNQLSYGFHDYFTMGVGIMPLFFFVSSDSFVHRSSLFFSEIGEILFSSRSKFWDHNYS